MLKVSRAFLIPGCFLLIILIICADYGTSFDAFCLSCHEMQPFKESLAHSTHARDAKGTEVRCADCHVDSKNLLSRLSTKVFTGTFSLTTHIFSQFPSEEKELDLLKESARSHIADSSCRACHEDLMLNAKKDGPVSSKGRNDHQKYLKHNPHPDRGACGPCHRKIERFSPKKKKIEILSCISCHEDLVHHARKSRPLPSR